MFLQYEFFQNLSEQRKEGRRAKRRHLLKLLRFQRKLLLRKRLRRLFLSKKLMLLKRLRKVFLSRQL